MTPSWLATLVAVVLAAVVVWWERWRLARPGGPYARADFSGLILLAALAVSWWGELPGAGPLRLLLLGALIVWVSSALCDLLNWNLALVSVALVAGAIVAGQGGVVVTSVKLPFTVTFVDLGWAGPVVSVVWLLLCGLVFGRSAGLLEIPLGVGALASLTFYAICLLEPEITGPAAALAAVTLGLAALVQVPFARYLGYGRARAGAVTLGYLLGGVAILGALKNTAFLVALLPLLVIGVPLFSVTYAYAADLRKGWRALAVQEKRKPLDELLLGQGYSRGQVVGLLLAGTAYLCLLGLLLVLLIEVSFLLKALLLLPAVLGGGVLFYVILRLLPRRTEGKSQQPQEISLLGIRVDAVTYDQALAEIEQFLREDRPHMIVTSDASAVMRAQDDEELRTIMNQADLVTADGAGVILAAKLLNLPLEVRVSGCDLAVHLCEAAARQGRSVYFLGGEPGVAEEAAEVLRRQISGLEVAGCRHGYFEEKEEQQIVQEIRETRPGLLLVALGLPRQEKWIKQHLQELGVPVCIGVGGSLDVISGRKRRAPRWMQRAGLEWLYRTLKEPRRLTRLSALPRMVWMTFRELLRR